MALRLIKKSCISPQVVLHPKETFITDSNIAFQLPLIHDKRLSTRTP